MRRRSRKTERCNNKVGRFRTSKINNWTELRNICPARNATKNKQVRISNTATDKHDVIALIVLPISKRWENFVVRWIHRMITFLSCCDIQLRHGVIILWWIDSLPDSNSVRRAHLRRIPLVITWYLPARRVDGARSKWSGIIVICRAVFSIHVISAIRVLPLSVKTFEYQAPRKSWPMSCCINNAASATWLDRYLNIVGRWVR